MVDAYELLQQVSPSKATTLSVYEINYLLAKTKVKDAMYANPICTTPDALLEEAAVLMRDNNVGALPVVDHGKLVGIITETLNASCRMNGRASYCH